MFKEGCLPHRISAFIILKRIFPSFLVSLLHAFGTAPPILQENKTAGVILLPHKTVGTGGRGVNLFSDVQDLNLDTDQLPSKAAGIDESICLHKFPISFRTS